MSKMPDTYFFDTYAIFEIIGGNPKYHFYINSIPITTIFNLAELNYNLKKEMEKYKADIITEKYWECLEEVYIEDIKKAMDLKTKYRNLSIPDVIGYVVAKRLGIKFLTGDEAFRNMENVEFIKK
ncbi:PIN domain-containing protein [Candidatus Woesearchaeota archaeon]|nr:PIN domain-containing protein [Candidatus Woesearchaeota archaeon]